MSLQFCRALYYPLIIVISLLILKWVNMSQACLAGFVFSIPLLLILHAALSFFITHKDQDCVKPQVPVRLLVYLVSFFLPIATVPFCKWNIMGGVSQCSFELLGLMPILNSMFMDLLFLSIFTFGAPLLIYIAITISISEILSFVVCRKRDLDVVAVSPSNVEKEIKDVNKCVETAKVSKHLILTIIILYLAELLFLIKAPTAAHVAFKPILPKDLHREVTVVYAKEESKKSSKKKDDKKKDAKKKVIKKPAVAAPSQR